MAWLPLPPSLSNGQVVKYKIEYSLGKEGESREGTGSPGWELCDCEMLVRASEDLSRVAWSLRKLGSTEEEGKVNPECGLGVEVAAMKRG